ncbi:MULTISPECIES: CynX/NimT family MFS transporter [unclassified Methylophilus]|uniref:MFS transporter n=1 Tax=unclassified Methylophilus TaxID=2630143 RepID=UPI0003A2E0CB|nr:MULTISPECIES: MFS transporter [unclassified Methylophilus]
MNSSKGSRAGFSRSEWWLVVAIVLVAIGLRPGIVSMGPALPAIIEAFQLSHAVASMMTAIPDLLMGALALPTPWLVRRFGVNKVLMVALSVLSISMLVRAYSCGSVLLLSTTVGVGAGIAVAGAMFAGIAKASFANRAALIMGIYATALSLGSTLSAGLTGWILQFAGWRLATGVWAAFAAIAIVAWWLVIRKSLTTRQVSEPLAMEAVAPRLPLRTPVAWMIALFFACVNFLFYSILTWTAAMYQETGMPAAEAGAVLASFTFCFMLASPVVGMYSRQLDRRGWLTGCALLSTVGLAGMATPGASPWLWVPVTAFGLGGAFTLAMTLPLDHTHTPDAANRWNAFVLTIGYLIAATGPFIMGLMHDRSGHFVGGYQLLVAVSVLMLLLATRLKPPRH